MLTNEFELILDELGKAFGVPHLTPDDNLKTTCEFQVYGDIIIQIEPDKNPDYLLIATILGDLPAGKFGEDLLEAALKVNGLPAPLNGILAYSQKNNHLLLFERFRTQNLRGEDLADFIKIFIQKAKIWKEALNNNRIPVIDEIQSSDRVGIFGLRP